MLFQHLSIEGLTELGHWEWKWKERKRRKERRLPAMQPLAVGLRSHHHQAISTADQGL